MPPTHSRRARLRDPPISSITILSGRQLLSPQPPLAWDEARRRSQAQRAADRGRSVGTDGATSKQAAGARGRLDPSALWSTSRDESRCGGTPARLFCANARRLYLFLCV